MKEQTKMTDMVKKKALLSSLILCMVLQSMQGQFKDCQIQVAPFSTPYADEFSPVYYGKGLLFCSNQPENAVIRYTSAGAPLFRMYFTEQKSLTKWARPEAQSWLSSSGSHVGPVTLSKDSATIYFSRNNDPGKSFKNIRDTANKLGIYIAEKRNGVWEQIGPFIYNDPHYTFATPSLDQDGMRIYFSSDKPGGYGGMDIYYCDWCKEKWCPPVNMGPSINTSGNESFPYADASGRVFFSSDTHPGRGGKDIFYTMQHNNVWINPVPLDSVFNSPYDDFGIVIDSTGQNGYFSSNRLKTDDIFTFSSAVPDFHSCIPASKENYCFTFYDEQHASDSVSLLYIWDFGNGIIRKGEKVGHCFTGAGKYHVQLKIYDLSTDTSLLSSVGYPVDLSSPEEPFINSRNTARKGEALDLYAENVLKKDSQITGYYWNAGSGYVSGKSYFRAVFPDKGFYTVNLGITKAGAKAGVVQNNCVSKQIWVTDEVYCIEKKNHSNKDDILTKVILAGDFSRSRKESIEQLFTNITFVIYQNNTEIEPDTCRILQAITRLLSDNPDLELEITIPAYFNGNLSDARVVTEQWARTLEFYFKKHGIESDRMKCSALVGSFLGNENNPYLEEAAGVVEFLIINRQ